MVFFITIMLMNVFRLRLYKKFYRNSHQRCSLREGVLRNFAKFTGKHLYQNLFFNKVADPSLQIY